MFSRKRSKKATAVEAADLTPSAVGPAEAGPPSPEAHDPGTATDDVFFPSAHEMLIGDGIEITGEIRNCARLVIAGTFTGTLHASEVLILSKASLNAAIVANRVDVFGQVAGEIVAAESVRFREGSLFDGRLIYRQMLVDPGALISGELSQYTSEDERAALDRLETFGQSSDDAISLTGEAAIELSEPESPGRTARAGG